MIKLTIAAHTALPWHTHPFPNAGYVLSGELTLQDRESGKSETFHAGQAFAESVDDVHRGVSGDTATVSSDLLRYARHANIDPQRRRHDRALGWSVHADRWSEQASWLNAEEKQRLTRRFDVERREQLPDAVERPRAYHGGD
jgi:hypothetical protein